MKDKNQQKMPRTRKLQITSPSPCHGMRAHLVIHTSLQYLELIFEANEIVDNDSYRVRDTRFNMNGDAVLLHAVIPIPISSPLRVFKHEGRPAVGKAADHRVETPLRYSSVSRGRIALHGRMRVQDSTLDLNRVTPYVCARVKDMILFNCFLQHVPCLLRDRQSRQPSGAMYGKYTYSPVVKVL